MKSRTQRNYERLRQEHGGNLTNLAAMARVSVATISRIITGQNSPSVPQIQTLALELDKEQGANLIADYCRDIIPKGLRRQIRIQVLSENSACLSTERLPGSLEFLPVAGQQMIEKLVQLCLENEDVLQGFIKEVNAVYDPHANETNSS